MSLENQSAQAKKTQKELIREFDYMILNYIKEIYSLSLLCTGNNQLKLEIRAECDGAYL
jgi:hypothetical protein